MKRLFYIFICISLISCANNKTSPLNSNEVEQIETSNGFLTTEIQGQLKTAEKLKLLMNEKKYSEAILLFSKNQQKNIAEIKKDKEIFKYWCSVWTFDDAKYERYINRIKSGNGQFVFEENEWKIDEK